LQASGKKVRQKAPQGAGCQRAEVRGVAITRRGAARAVVLSIEDYGALAAHKPDFRMHLLGGSKVR
jgi:hypothetical protein